MPGKNTPEHFWNRLDRSGGEDSCWEFQGSRDAKGYGFAHHDGQRYRAHRLAFKLKYGIEPGTLFVCHKCDNPSCCNPGHLFLGTRSDNMLDCFEKGRLASPFMGRQGSDVHNAKLTDDDVRVIRARYDAGERYSSIHRDYPHVNHTLVWQVCKRKIWNHI